MSAEPRLLIIEWAVFRWLGAAQAAASEGFKTAMIAIWSAGLWLIEITMKLVDVFLTPDLTASGPARTMVPLMMGIALCLAAVLVLAQLMGAVI